MSHRVLLREARDPRAAPVLLLHGLLGSPQSWQEVVSALGHAGPIHAAVLPGHGRPPRPMPSSFEAAADELANDLPHASVVVGYSLGGRLALGMAAFRPDKTRAVIAIGAQLGLIGEVERAERRSWEREQQELLEKAGLAAFVAHWESQGLFASQRSLDAQRLERQRSQRLAHDARGIAAAMDVLGSGRMPDLLPRVTRERVPVLMVAGESDPRFVARAHAAATAAPNIEARIVAHAGHNVVLEEPEILAGILDQQLSRWSPAHHLEKIA